MKANEFVKEFGWEEVKEIVDGLKVDFYFKGIKTSPVVIFDDGETWCSYDDLKHLVESWQLVQDYGGVSKAKDFISPYSLDQLSKKVYSPMLRLKQAILDVESCQ